MKKKFSRNDYEIYVERLTEYPSWIDNYIERLLQVSSINASARFLKGIKKGSATRAPHTSDLYGAVATVE